MPKWSGLTLTDLGKELQARAQAGEQLVFTHIKIGDGQVGANVSLGSLTDLVSVKKTLSINSCEVNEQQQCEISSVLSNAGVQTGFYVRELGLYAQDMDDEDEEMLYAYSQDGNPDFLPEDGSSVTLSEKFTILVNIGNITDVTANIDVGGWATSGYVGQKLGEHDADPDAHYDMTGATTAAAGARGFVPAPTAGNTKRCLQADGTWGVPQDTKYNVMQGASATAAGLEGLVPQPGAGKQQAFLRGDGTWEMPALQFYPVGAIYLSVVNTSPAVLFGGTWARIKDRFLLAAGDSYAAGGTGGEASHVLTANEMPPHNHGASVVSAGGHTHSETSAGAHTHTVNAAGAHTHERGTMNITGQFYIDRATDQNKGEGAFYATTRYGNRTCDDSAGRNNNYIGFDASRTWSGATSSAGNHTHTLGSNGAHSHTINSSGAHTHTVNVNNTGGGQAHNNMPPYLTVYMWQRIA